MRLLAMSVALLAAVGCGGGTIKSTNGQLYPANRSEDAMRASASRDLVCPPQGVSLVHDRAEERMSLVSAEGCGQRVTYMLSSGYGGRGRYVMVNRSVLASPVGESAALLPRQAPR